MAAYPDPTTLSAKRLHERLVRDVTKHRATPLPWFTAAIIRIGELERTGPEQAMQDLIADCTSRGFPPQRWPLARATPDELRRLGL